MGLCIRPVMLRSARSSPASPGRHLPHLQDPPGFCSLELHHRALCAALGAACLSGLASRHREQLLVPDPRGAGTSKKMQEDPRPTETPVARYKAQVTHTRTAGSGLAR